MADEADHGTVAAQTILMDWDPTHPSIEILGQKLRASYTAGGKTVEAEAEVGRNKKLIRTAVHIMRTTLGNNSTGVVTAAQAERRVNCWFRRVWAQIEMAPQLGPRALH